MIFLDDKKRRETIMSSRKSAKGEDLGAAEMKSEVVKDDDGVIDGRHVAAQDAMAALADKSPENFMRAMINMMDIHMGMEKPEEE